MPVLLPTTALRISVQHHPMVSGSNNAKKTQISSRLSKSGDPSSPSSRPMSNSLGLIPTEAFRRAQTVAALDVAVHASSPVGFTSAPSSPRSSFASPQLIMSPMSVVPSRMPASLKEGPWWPREQDSRAIQQVTAWQDVDLLDDTMLDASSNKSEESVDARRRRTPSVDFFSVAPVRSESALRGVSPTRCSGMVHAHVKPILDTSVKHVKMLCA